MRYAKKDKVKIIVLASVLAALWLLIGLRFVMLSRETKAKMEAENARRAAVQATQATGQLNQLTSPTARLAALIKPVDPPKADPFRPVIAPRSTLTASRSKPSEAAPILPPLDDEASARRREDLHVTGIINGNPSTAVLRVDDQHYVVKAGDWLDDQVQVAEIGKDGVTLRDGRHSYTLRLGR